MHRHVQSLVLTITVIVTGAFLLTGCASTSQNANASSDEMADIDQLLGLDGSGDEAVGEDDVLQMLGIAEEAAIDSDYDEMGIDNPPPAGLENEVRDLESQQDQLDMQTRNLQQRVTTQEEQIASLSTEPRKADAASSQSGFNSQYQDALQTYRNRKYSEAIQKFDNLLLENSKNSLADNAQYWIGESYYGMGSYQKAVAAFEKVFTFSNSNKDDAAQLKLGLCYMKLNDNAKAREELQKLINEYPASESVGLAKRLLDQIQTSP